MMNDLDRYKTEDYGKLFLYFFELYVTSFNIGVAIDEFEENRKNLPNISIDKGDEVKNFLLECTSYLQEGYTPFLLAFLMDRQCLECVKADTSKEQQSMIYLAQRLIAGIHHGDIRAILDTARLWNDEIRDFAEMSFYPRLPRDIREKYYL